MPARGPGSTQPDDLDFVPLDSVDEQQASWRDKRPDLDFDALGIVLRLARVQGYFAREIQQVIESHGLSTPDFGVLVTLARLGDQAVSQRRLMDELALTSGTISVRIDRLVHAGLVESEVDSDSKRTTSITLTPKGRRLFDKAVPTHLANQLRLVSSLTQTERKQLEDLLRKILIEFEGSKPLSGAELALGLTLWSVHVSSDVRRAAGLEPSLGLLVKAVEPESPAEVAGIREGDVLTRAGDHAITSVAAIWAALSDVSGKAELTLWLRRGDRELNVTLPVAKRAVTRARTLGRAGQPEHRL